LDTFPVLITFLNSLSLIANQNWVGVSIRVLVVDDNEEITDVLVFYFQELGIDCEFTKNGTEGLELIRQKKYDLILLDIAMPEYSGFDVIDSLKRDRLLEQENVVVFTASARPILDKLEQSGVKDVLWKPCNLDELRALIEKYRY
jgi:CheY-like chemotaxis protein